MYSLHTYDVGMFGHIFIPGYPLEAIGISHWLISHAIANIMATADEQTSANREIEFAMDHYLNKYFETFPDELLEYIENQAFFYYVKVHNYFSQFKPIEVVDTPDTKAGVAIILKD
ncbi:hypothetical protein MZD04_gp043 [Pseudomonas phage Psa21]|uniref:Uncharacterized protein n=1 Tax=Pseudomonas phage Psa21 TaxID=2530023 RepID=A0A481W5B2_9CAUD|nr:hypothetical protein MZD04_gp043 [Pseudomonas phage Psa21]QBJ02573.1 hypothetical protein PSA21_43 [Pseudomonas phage Psa21]